MNLIETLIAAVPADFVLGAFTKPKTDSERVLGTLESLPTETREVLRARAYYAREYFDTRDKHRALHHDPTYDASACEAHHESLGVLADAMDDLHEEAVGLVYEHFGIDQEREVIGFRAEGIVAGPPITPEPQVPSFIRELAEALSGKVEIIGEAGGIVAITISTPSRRTE